MARFAPSPTGPLHAGSLLAAVGSYLDARAHGARWLVRIEDLDTPRVIPGCADEQLRTLDAFGFEWDGEVLYQSSRREAYRDAMARLAAAGRSFACSCSRKDLGAGNEDALGYPGTCRNGPTKPGPTAQRFRVSDTHVEFEDLFQGTQSFDLAACGDFVIERRDGIASYQLAVVVDDAFQGITRVVRGADLVASTPWQLDLQDALGMPRPIYGHLPLLLEPDGSKLSKSKRALPVDPRPKGSGALDAAVVARALTSLEQAAVSKVLTSTLTLLSQSPPPDLAQSKVEDIWKWAFAHWQPQALAGHTRVLLSACSDNQAEFAPEIVGCG